MRVLVCGSRRWHDREAISARLAEIPPPLDDVVIVVGYNPKKDTPKGADRIAYQEAQKLGLLVEPHPADWERYGKSAGYIRNKEMVDQGADLCIAFWDGRSKGTEHTMGLARIANIPVEAIR